MTDAGKTGREARCCCGRFHDAELPQIINYIVHEALGPSGNFCGPLVNHELRDARAELSVLREETGIKLAAISTAAMCNTRESAEKQKIEKDNPYWTVAYEDVREAVKREMGLREELESLRSRHDAMREAAHRVAQRFDTPSGRRGQRGGRKTMRRIIVALFAVFFVVKWTEIMAVGGEREFISNLQMGDRCMCSLVFSAQESRPFAELEDAKAFAKTLGEEKPRLVYDVKIERHDVKDVRP